MKLKINNKNKKNKRDYLSSGTLNRARKLRGKALVLFTVILLSLIFQMDFPMNTNKNSEELLTPIDEDLYLSRDNGHIFKFVQGTQYGPAVLDPTNSWDTASNDVVERVCETLWTYNLSDPDLPLINHLAQSEVWINPTRLQVTLRQGIIFHDGAPFNATAAKWSIDRMLYLMNHTGQMPPSPPYRAQTYSVYEFPDGRPIINRTVFRNDYLFDIYLNDPFPPLLELMSFAACSMVSPKSTSATSFIDLNTGDLVGTGPFVYDEYIPEIEVRFHGFKDYWQGKPNIDVLVFNIVGDSNIRNNAMLDGIFDYLDGADKDSYDLFKANPDITIHEVDKPGMAYYYLGMNNNKINVTWRKAMSYAFNYTSFITEYYEDDAFRSYGPISAGWSDFYDPTINETAAFFNLTIARQTLIDDPGIDTSGLTANDDPNNATWEAANLATFNYSYNWGSTVREELYPLLVDWFDNIGITVLDGGTSGKFFFNLILGNFSGAFDVLELFYVGWAPDYLEPLNMFQPLFSNISSANSAQVNNGTLEAMISAASAETNDILRNEIYSNISHYLAGTLYPHIFGMHKKITYVHSKAIENVPYNTYGKLDAYSVSLNKNLSQSINIANIHITGNNWTDAITAGICTGSGTSSDPYVIDNEIIDANGYGAGILIENSDAYFKISNCQVYNSEGFRTYYAGISLFNVSNGQVINNNCSFNKGNGISLSDSDNNIVQGNIANNNSKSGMFIEDSDNNKIVKNTANHNNESGMHFSGYGNFNKIKRNKMMHNNDSGLYLSTHFKFNDITRNIMSNNTQYGIRIMYNCDNNTFSENIIVNNSVIGLSIEETYGWNNLNLIYHNVFIGNQVHARDDEDDNMWNNPTAGNYWDNYTGADTSPYDGIGDDPIDIPGDGGNQDLFPLFNNPDYYNRMIYIDGSGVKALDWSEAANAFWRTTGSGTWDDPYLIENTTITNGEFIIIANSTDHFMLRNCTVRNSNLYYPYSGILLTNTSNGRLIDNDCSYNIYDGILLSNSHNNTLSGNTASNSLYAQGIHLVKSTNNKITGNTLNYNDLYGINLDRSINNIVSGNTVYNNTDDGIVLFSSSQNTIILNNITRSLKNGIYLHNSSINLIGGNTVYNNTNDGIYLVNSSLNWVEMNTVYDNNWNGINLIRSNHTEISGNTVYTNTQNGINLWRSNISIISGNTVYNHSLKGIRLEYSNNSDVTGNIVYENDEEGIGLYYSNDTEITENNVYDNVNGIYIRLSSEITIMKNTINDNNPNGIDLYDCDNTLAIGNILNGNAVSPYDYFLGSNNIFQWNLANGYTDPIIIDDSGAGDFTWTQAINQIAWISGSGTSGDPYVIDNIIINGQNSDSCIEIGNSNAYLTIQNSEFTNSGSGSSDAGIKLDNANNIELYNDDSTFNNGYGIFLYYCQYIDISYCTVNNNSKDGINLFESDNNDISNNADTINSNNDHGIYLSLSHSNTISANAIHYNDYAVYLLDSNDNVITSNEWSNNNGTVYESPDCTGNTFSDNDIPYPIVGDGGLDPMIIIIIVISAAVIAVIVITGAIVRKKRSAKPRKAREERVEIIVGERREAVTTKEGKKREKQTKEKRKVEAKKRRLEDDLQKKISFADYLIKENKLELAVKNLLEIQKGAEDLKNTSMVKKAEERIFLCKKLQLEMKEKEERKEEVKAEKEIEKVEEKERPIEEVLQKRLASVDDLIKEKKMKLAIQNLVEIQKEAQTHELKDLANSIEEKIVSCKKSEVDTINRIKQTILTLGAKFSRLQLADISEKSGIEDEGLIESIILGMIRNKEIQGEYFSRSKALTLEVAAPVQLEEKAEGSNVFISYSTLDTDYFQVSKIVRRLELYPEINRVIFWEADSQQNIVEFMEETLRITNAFILFCSENSFKSGAVKGEWQSAYQMVKKGLMKMIPVYENEDYIPRLLWNMLNVKFTKDDFEGFIQKLYEEILR